MNVHTRYGKVMRVVSRENHERSMKLGLLIAIVIVTQVFIMLTDLKNQLVE